MLKKTAILKSLLAASIATLPGLTLAAEPYFGGNFALIEYSEEGVSDASLNAVYGRLGTFFGDNFSGEIRLGLGVGDDTVNFDGFDVDVELKNFFGAYLRGGVPVGESFYPYAVIGYSKGKIEMSAFDESISESESDVSFGVGADFSVAETVKVNLEYMNYIDKDGGELSGFSVGIAKSF
jgi:outer membrane immunogenic protein